MREWHSRWGMPYIMTSDRGSQFVSDMSLEVCSLMGIARDPTTSYHPQHNGKIERMHRSLKNSLRARLLGRVNWLSELSWVMLGLRAASNLDTGVSPSILVTGQQPTLPGQLVVQRPTIDDASNFGWRLLWQLKHSMRTHGTRNVEVSRPVDIKVFVSASRKSAIVARSEVHRPISGTTTMEVVLPFAVGEPRRYSLCRQTTTLLRGRDGSSRTGYRRRRHREKRHNR